MPSSTGGRLILTRQPGGARPQTLTQGLNVSVLIRRRSNRPKDQVAGSPEAVAGHLARFVSGGFSFLNLSVSPTADGVAHRERPAREVLPLLAQSGTRASGQLASRSSGPLPLLLVRVAALCGRQARVVSGPPPRGHCQRRNRKCGWSAGSTRLGVGQLCRGQQIGHVEQAGLGRR